MVQVTSAQARAMGLRTIISRKTGLARQMRRMRRKPLFPTSNQERQLMALRDGGTT